MAKIQRTLCRGVRVVMITAGGRRFFVLLLFALFLIHNQTTSVSKHIDIADSAPRNKHIDIADSAPRYTFFSVKDAQPRHRPREIASSAPRHVKTDEPPAHDRHRRRESPNLERANACLRKGKFAEAYAFYRKSVDEDPGNYVAHTNMASCLMKMDGSEYSHGIDMNTYDAALGHFRVARDLRPDLPATWSNLGSHLLAGGASLDVAETCFKRAIKLDEENLSYVLSLGAVYEAGNRGEEAVSVYRAGLKRAPKKSKIRAELWANLGTSLFTTRGNKEEAVAAYRSALRIDPSLANARINLNAVLGGQTGKFPASAASSFSDDAARVENEGVGADCSSEREWAGSVAWRRKCRARSSEDGDDDGSSRVSIPSSFGRRFEGTMYVFEVDTKRTSRDRWFAKEEGKTYFSFDASEGKRAVFEGLRRLAAEDSAEDVEDDVASRFPEPPHAVRELFASCESYARSAPSASTFAYVGYGRNARDAVKSLNRRRECASREDKAEGRTEIESASLRLYCNVDSQTMRAVTYRPSRDANVAPVVVDEKEYTLVTDMDVVHGLLHSAERIHSSLALLRKEIASNSEGDTPPPVRRNTIDHLSVWLKRSSSDSGVDMGSGGSPFFARTFRRIWFSFDPEAAARVPSGSIQRIQYGTTSVSKRNFTFVTFYYRTGAKEIAPIEDLASSVLSSQKGPFLELKEMNERGELERMSGAARLALAQDLTIGFRSAASSDDATTYDAMKDHVGSLQSLFAKEESVLLELGPRAETLRRAVEFIREKESDAKFATRRMAMIDTFRRRGGGHQDKVEETYDGAFGLSEMQSRWRRAPSSQPPMMSPISSSGAVTGSSSPHSFSLDNFMYGVVFVNSLKALFKLSRPAVRAVRASRRSDAYFLMLGSNVGAEAVFAALWLRLRTVGIEILCGLVAEAETVRDRTKIPPHVLSFRCGDAGNEGDLPDSIVERVGIAYSDDATWDVSNIRRVANRIASSLPADALVVTFRPVVWEAIRSRTGQSCFETQSASHVVASWSASPDGLVPVALLSATGACVGAADLG